MHLIEEIVVIVTALVFSARQVAELYKMFTEVKPVVKELTASTPVWSVRTEYPAKLNEPVTLTVVESQITDEGNQYTLTDSKGQTFLVVI
jgi:hypothetical protein